MALKSGLAAQIGFADEVTYGVPVAPTIFCPMILSDGIERTQEPIVSDAVIAGRRFRAPEQVALGLIGVAGSVPLELYNRGQTKLWKHMMGAVSTAGSGPYTHTFTPGELDGKSLTIQSAKPALDAIHPHTAAGCKVTGWEVAVGDAGEIPTLGLDVVGQFDQFGSRVVTDGVLNETTTVTSASAAFTAADAGKYVYGTGIPAGAYIASVTNATTVVLSAAATASATGVTVTIGTALGTATLPVGQRPFVGHGCTLSIGGSAKAVKGFTFGYEANLAAERRFIGTRTIAEPLESELREITGSIDREFVSLEDYERFVRGDVFTLSAVASDGIGSSLTIAIKAYYDSVAVSLNPGILEQSLPFVAVGDTDAEACTVTLVNSDSAA